MCYSYNSPKVLKCSFSFWATRDSPPLASRQRTRCQSQLIRSYYHQPSLGPWQEVLSGFCILTAHGLPSSQRTIDCSCLSSTHLEPLDRIHSQERWCCLRWHKDWQGALYLGCSAHPWSAVGGDIQPVASPSEVPLLLRNLRCHEKTTCTKCYSCRISDLDEQLRLCDPKDAIIPFWAPVRGGMDDL